MTTVAQVCLYGTAARGFAYLAARPGLVGTIVARGGWNFEETQPSGAHRSLTETIDAAKASLRAAGIEQGDVEVYFPGGTHRARTPVDRHQAVSSMHLEEAPAAVVTSKRIERAAREIAKAQATEPLEEWYANSVAWRRLVRAGRREARRLVSIFQGDLVWVASGPGDEGRWGIALGFSRARRQVEVDGQWVDLVRVLMRQEAIADGVTPPAHPDSPGHGAFALLIDALRSVVSQGRTIEFDTFGGGHHRMQVAAVSNALGTGSIGQLEVSGAIGGHTAQLVIPSDYDLDGTPLRVAELRWSAIRRQRVDPRTIRFVASGARRAPARRAGRSDSATAGATSTPPDEWKQNRVVWYRPVDHGNARCRVELNRGDLVWASFGASSARKSGVWGRVSGLSHARQKIKVREAWYELPLVYTYDEAIESGVTPPDDERETGPADAPFVQLVAGLRAPNARGRILELVSTDATPHRLQVRRVQQGVRELVVVGTIKRSEAKLTLRTQTDAAGRPKYDAQLQRGSRAYRVDPRRIHFAARARAGRSTGGAR